jgi:hypothetical protein
LGNIISFVNLKRSQPGYIMLNESMENSVTASTPILLEMGRNFFNAEIIDVPGNLPAAQVLQNEIKKEMAIYTTDNNIVVKKRSFDTGNG